MTERTTISFSLCFYQVATTVLSPAQIASPIRELLKNQRNATVFLGEVTGINKDAKFVYVSNEDHKDAPIRYDILIVATGVTQSYFGRDEFAEFAPGLKELADAVRIRNKVLKAFERAEAEDNPSLRQDLLTLVLVGAGRRGRGCRRRRAYQKQCRHLDGRSCPISSWKMAERRDGPRRPRSYSERSHRSRTPRHLRTRRYSFARTGRKTAAWCRPSGYSTRPLCWASHRSRLAW